MAIINIREKKIFFRFHNLKTGWFCRTHQPFESSVLCVYCLRISKMLAKQFSTSFSKVFTLVLIVSSQMFDTVQGGGHGGGGSQYCLSSDGFHSPECGPAGIQSPPEVTEENTIKGTGYFSWNATNMNLEITIPGVFPPTPISPKKLRMQSGHTFHLGYLLGLINGIIVFGLTFWEQIMH
ncbi:uncharacterized protein LOC124313195 isoform X2 [Daphnia pulicaria]|uniref:uncharacterized protein LOC124313195 isoform X2 n=1 Tax=Daphnia pulicaria TaxID=35523 RepID=UPI001EEC8C05|nr:uncharacterized protein LOC124313195 isoform X2 [Daphnia pulicaria]